MSKNLQAWFALWNKRLQNAYSFQGDSVACGLVACAAASLLEADGKPWKLCMLHTEDWNKALKPKPYPELEWGGHVICISEDKVFDPILEKPLPLDSYLETLFPNQKTTLRHLENTLGKNNPYELQKEKKQGRKEELSLSL